MIKLQRNMGTLDRTLRAIVGVVLIAVVFVGPKTAWGWLGLIPLATAIFAFCPPYALFGWDTRGKNKAG